MSPSGTAGGLDERRGMTPSKSVLSERAAAKGGTTPANMVGAARRALVKTKSTIGGPGPDRGSIRRKNARAAARVHTDHLRSSKFCKCLPLESPALKGVGGGGLPELGGAEKNRLNVFEVRVFNGFLNETQEEFIQKCLEAKAKSKYRLNFPDSRHPSTGHPYNTTGPRTPARNTY